MPAPRIAALALSLLLAGGLVACGGDDGGDDAGGGGGDEVSGETVSAGAYAKDVCGAMSEWLSGIQELSSSIAESFQSGSPEEGKEILSTLLTDMSAETDELVTAVGEAGIPDVEGGEAVANDLVTAFGKARDALAAAREDVEALPNDQQGFEEGTAALGPTLQQSISGITGSLSAPESQELKDAFAKEPSCATVAP